MKTLFNITVKYEKKVQEGNEEKIEKLLEKYAFECINFSDCENKITAYLKDRIYGEFSVDSIQKQKYDDVIFQDHLKGSNEEYYWYDVKVTIELVDDNGNTKYKQEKYLVQSESLEDAVEYTLKYIEKFDDEVYLSGVNETALEEVVLYEDLKNLINE